MTHRTALLALAFALPLFSTPAAFAGTSVYTDIDLEHCTSYSGGAPVEEEDYLELKCKGYKDYPIYFKEGDVRQSTYFGFLKPEIIERAAETFGRFNHIARKLEWRLDEKGMPYATILRYFMENTDPATGDLDEKLYGQVLVVSRVGRPGEEIGCVAAYVDALENKDANAMAQKLADSLAPTFACGKDKPQFHGLKGERSNEAYYNFPNLTD